MLLHYAQLEYEVNSANMGVPGFIFGLVFCILIYLSKGQPLPHEDLRNETSCSLDVNIICSSNEIIAVHSLYFMYDQVCDHMCCTYNSSHSSVGADESDIQEIRRLCSGHESCRYQPHGIRNFGSIGVKNPSYVMVQYFCISGSRVNTVCSNQEITSQGMPLYLTNKNYPSVTTGNSTCSCSLEINSCSSNIQLYLFDLDLYLETGTCEQSLEFTNNKDGVFEKVNCESYNSNNVTSMNLSSHYVKVDFIDESIQDQEGYFLLGFEATGDNVSFSISCPHREESICLDCEDKSDVPNGNISPQDANNTSKGALADVICTTGYETNKTMVSCLGIGQWENATCSAKDCGSVPVIKNGLYTLKDNQNTTYGALATVTCSEGFEPESNISNCLDSGLWSRVSCTSKIIDCGSTYGLENGKITLVSDVTNVGTVATVTCNTGYKASMTSIRCLQSGEWEIATCTLKDCGNPASIQYGNITLLDDASTTYNSTARVACQDGYKAKKQVITCKESEKWERSSCEPKEDIQQAEDESATTIILLAVLLPISVCLCILALYLIWRYRHRLCKSSSSKHESVSFKNEEVLPEDRDCENLNVSFVNENALPKDQLCQDSNESSKNEDDLPKEKQSKDANESPNTVDVLPKQQSQDPNSSVNTEDVLETQQCPDSIKTSPTAEIVPDKEKSHHNIVKTEDALPEKQPSQDSDVL